MQSDFLIMLLDKGFWAYHNSTLSVTLWHMMSLVVAGSCILNSSALSDHILSHLECIITNLFCVGPSWPLASSQFYLGLVSPLLPSNKSLLSYSPDVWCIFSCLVHSCHLHSICLTAQIWGLALCHYLSATSIGVAHRESSLCDISLTLPLHLQYLLHL